jgi:hypothetical protein
VFRGKSHWVTFKYEKMPLFCFLCGCIVHGQKGCPTGTQKRVSILDKEKQWGPWLQADSTKQQTKLVSKGSEDFSHSDGGAAEGSHQVGYQTIGRSSGNLGN